MHVNADSLDEEVRITVEAAVEVTNVLLDEDLPIDERRAAVIRVLADHDFTRAASASETDVVAMYDRSMAISRLVDQLTDLSLVDAVDQVNVALEGCAIAPSLSGHDGFPLHIHWTPAATPFAHQVAVDLLMAIAQTLCDHGTDRFGRCAADDCDRVFYDSTKNRSRRFCSDPRCASRTRTAAHRARAGDG